MSQEKIVRNKKILAMREAKVNSHKISYDKIARAFGLTKKTVYEIIKREKQKSVGSGKKA